MTSGLGEADVPSFNTLSPARLLLFVLTGVPASIGESSTIALEHAGLGSIRRETG